MDYPDPQDFIQPLFLCGSVGAGGSNNAWYCSQEVEQLFEKAEATSEQAERLKQYQQLERLLVEDAPRVSLFHLAAYTLSSAGHESGARFGPGNHDVLCFQCQDSRRSLDGRRREKTRRIAPCANVAPEQDHRGTVSRRIWAGPERLKQYQQLERLLVEDAPRVSLFHLAAYTLYGEASGAAVGQPRQLRPSGRARSGGRSSPRAVSCSDLRIRYGAHL